ncbi:MAG: MotA/TolQ/ExbB proton channel family protein [Burkholderiaceae bacterium]
MDTQFGLAHVWAQGDWVTRAVALILLGMSLASWLVILIKALDLRTHRQQAKASEAFWHATDFEDGLSKLGQEANNPFRQLAETGRDATRHILRQDDPTGRSSHRPQLHDQLDVSDWVTRELRSAIDEFTARLQGGLAILASVGSTAPFVGLFGTVWGIYHALLGIGAAGQATIDKVAGPIGEALIMTALGLAVAIPAVLGYNALVRGNKGVLHKLNRFGHDLHALFVTGARVSQGGQAAGPAPAPAVVALRKP